jgi:hypothetical protein
MGIDDFDRYAREANDEKRDAKRERDQRERQWDARMRRNESPEDKRPRYHLYMNEWRQ